MALRIPAGSRRLRRPRGWAVRRCSTAGRVTASLCRRARRLPVVEERYLCLASDQAFARGLGWCGLRAHGWIRRSLDVRGAGSPTSGLGGLVCSRSGADCRGPRRELSGVPSPGIGVHGATTYDRNVAAEEPPTPEATEIARRGGSIYLSTAARGPQRILPRVHRSSRRIDR